jgi:TolB-like protein
MDFGTGHAADDAARGSQTAGTPLYLAPEILDGQPASIQSDIYALGVLLFFLTSATYPATARSVGALTEQHRGGHRRRLGETRTDLSPAFVAVIDRALDPNPRERFRTAAEMATALTHSMTGTLPAPGDVPAAAPQPWRRRAVAMGLVLALAGALGYGAWMWSGGSQAPPPGSGPHTVAVLAFEDLSNDRSGRTLSDGLSDLLITDLGQHRELSVMARTSSRQFVGNRRALDLAREYGVNFIVEGSVRPNGGSWTVATRVVSATSGTLLGGVTFDTDLARLGETAARMAASVTATLQVPARKVPPAASIDADAMEAYLRGWSEYWRLTREGFQEAERLFTVTTDRAPSYAAGHAALAYVTFQLEKAYKAYPPGVGAAAAMKHAQTAVRLDPQSPQALAALGWIEFYGSWQWRSAEDLLRRAVELNPSDAQNRWMYAQLLMAENRLDAALQEARLVQRLDPLTPARYSNIATVLYYDRQYEEALREAQQLLSRDPNATVGHFGMARFLTALGRHDEAIRMIQTSGNAGEPPVRAGSTRR